MPSESWRRKKPKLDLAVVGHGRGATTYAAWWLINNGIQVKHERVGAQGIVDSGLAVPTWGVRGGVHQGLQRTDFIWKAKICIVRDPYATVATYEQIEPARNIFTHGYPHLPLLYDDLLPNGFHDWPDAAQLEYAVNNRELRINTIARSVCRWTTLGIKWCDDEFFRAEDEWHREMPDWLKRCGLWTREEEAVEPPKEQRNSRPGRRLTVDEIDEFLTDSTKKELKDFRARLGYA